MRTCVACLFVVAACGGSPGSADDVPDLDSGLDAAPWHPNGETVIHGEDPTAPENTNGLVVDGNLVYWVGEYNGLVSVHSHDLLSGAERVLASEISGATFLFQNTDDLFFFDYPDLIKAVRKTGGQGATRVLVTSGTDNPRAMAVDGTHIYWAEAATIYTIDSDGNNMRPVGSLADTVQYLAADATRVYALSVSGLYSLPVGGGTPTLMTAENPGAEGNILASGDYVYFSDRGRDRVVRVPKAGPAGAFEAIGGMQNDPGRLAADGGELFWVNRPRPGTGAVMRLRAGAATAETFASATFPADVAVTPTAIFWTDYSAHTVMAAPR